MIKYVTGEDHLRRRISLAIDTHAACKLCRLADGKLGGKKRS
jgi:hypothetical protein